MAKSKVKVPVSERALFSRINRVLKKDGESLRRCREQSRSFTDLGYYYIVDIMRNAITASHGDLEKWGREMNVLKPYEALSEN